MDMHNRENYPIFSVLLLPQISLEYAELGVMEKFKVIQYLDSKIIYSFLNKI